MRRSAGSTPATNKKKSDRAKATLEAIRDQMYGQRIADTYRSLQLLSGYCVDTLQTPSDRPFNAAELAVRLDKMTADVAPGTRASVTHGEAADQFIDAKLDPQLGRMRAQKRTWEHVLWLTTKLDVLKVDKVSVEHIRLLPDHIIGTREDEMLLPPRSRAGGPLHLDWGRIDSAMRKLAGR